MKRLGIGGAIWLLALAPILLGAPLKIAVAVWCLISTAIILVPPGRRAQRATAIYLFLIVFPMVDYIGEAGAGSIGGAPVSLAYYPADFWLLLAIGFALFERDLRAPDPRFRRLLLAAGAFSFLVLPSVFIACSPISALQQWFVIPRAAVLGLLVFSQARRRDGFRLLIASLMAGFVVQIVVAAAQQALGSVLDLGLLGEAPQKHLFKYIAHGVPLWRSGGTMGHPNVFATYLLGMLSAVLGLTLSRRSPISRGGMGLLFLGGLAALVWSYSRAAWAVGMLTLGPLMLWAMWRVLPRRVALGSVAILALVMVLVAPAVTFRLIKTESSATDVRRVLIPVALQMTSVYPWFGVGLSEFSDRIPSFDPLRKLGQFRHPVHNIVLLDLAEGGVLGGLGSLILWIGVLSVALSGVCRRGDVKSMITKGIWVGVVAMVFHNCVDWTARCPVIELLLWTLMGLACGASAGETARSGRSIGPKELEHA